MATKNPFDLLGDFDVEDPSQLTAAQLQKIEVKKTPAPSDKPAVAQPKLPSKPLPPSQAVREARSGPARGGRGYERGRGSGGVSYRDSSNNERSYENREITGGQSDAEIGKPYERRGAYGGPRGTFHGDQRGGLSNGDIGEGYRERPHRPFEQHSGTGRGSDFKREGAGRRNWRTQTDEPAQMAEKVSNEGEKNPNLNNEKPSVHEDAAAGGGKEAAINDVEEKEPEVKEMTLEEYEKVLEEKRKALLAPKPEERKIDVKTFESMQQLANKKTNDEIFVKLGSEKDKKKELAEKEARAKKSVSINEFLKPAEGERYFSGGGRGTRRGHSGAAETSNARSLSIEDPGQFPTLGGK